MSATGLGSATGGACGTGAALRVDVEEDAEPCAGDEDDVEEGCDEDSEEGDDGNNDEEDFESPANTTAATKNDNDNDNKDNKGSRTKRPPSILTSNTLPGSIQTSVSEMPADHVFRVQCGML